MINTFAIDLNVTDLAIATAIKARCRNAGPFRHEHHGDGGIIGAFHQNILTRTAPMTAGTARF